MKRSLAAILLLLHGLLIFSQTGPAGVGTPSTNVFWLKADKGTSSSTNNTPISFWNDQSGNSINMSQTVSAQQPSFATNVMNGFPAIQFDNVNASNQNDKMLGPDSPILDSTAGYSFFTVTRPQNFGDAHVIVSKRTTVSVDQSFMLFYYTGNKMTIDVQTTNDRFASNTAYSTNTNYIIDLYYDGTIANPRCMLYNDETLDIAANETSTFVPNNASPIILGTTDASDPRPYGGYMSEIIIYRQNLVPACRSIVNNYLSAKYNIALSANDHYAGDNAGNGDYDFDVAGIGKESTGSNTTFSPSICAGLGISAVAGLDNTDYLMAGHALHTNSVITSDVAGLSGINKARWQRVWYIDVTNTSTNISANVVFDLSDGGLPGTPAFASNYVLLYRAGQSGTWTQLVSGASAISGDNIIFNNVTLVNDGYYTIGSVDYFTSPLPIELTEFNATAQGNAVALNWATASERNNAYFTVEKSQDGDSFEEVVTVAGAGTSSLRHTYNQIDNSPYEGLSYYRLKQTDTDKQSSYSPLVDVTFYKSNALNLFLYPNPSDDGTFYLSAGKTTYAAVTVEIVDVMGRSCLTKNYLLAAYQPASIINAEQPLAKGVYFATLTYGGTTHRQKLVVR